MARSGRGCAPGCPSERARRSVDGHVDEGGSILGGFASRREFLSSDVPRRSAAAYGASVYGQHARHSARKARLGSHALGQAGRKGRRKKGGVVNLRALPQRVARAALRALSPGGASPLYVRVKAKASDFIRFPCHPPRISQLERGMIALRRGPMT